MPFAGHPNVGTGYVLARREANPPEHLVFEELAGLVRVHILRDATKQITGARISAPRSLSIDIAIPTDVVAACAGVNEDDVLTTSHDAAGCLGRHAVRDRRGGEPRGAVARQSRPRARSATRQSVSPGSGARFALHLYVRVDGDATRLRTRMFAPLVGVLEDPATGSANAALAALLTSLAPGENVDLHLRHRAGRGDGPAEPDRRVGEEDGGRPGDGDRRRKLRARAARQAGDLNGLRAWLAPGAGGVEYRGLALCG